LDIKKSQSNFLEVMNPEASKGTALDFIAKKLGIEQQQVIAAGDSEIDQSMIEYAGLGVAVANAVPCVLDAADYVTSANDENGIAKVIDKFILGGK
ncbi:MAG: HAD hydrolase family protein, partial [Christensenellaceae bacterium]